MRVECCVLINCVGVCVGLEGFGNTRGRGRSTICLGISFGTIPLLILLPTCLHSLLLHFPPRHVLYLSSLFPQCSVFPNRSSASLSTSTLTPRRARLLWARNTWVSFYNRASSLSLSPSLSLSLSVAPRFSTLLSLSLPCTHFWGGVSRFDAC
jgi:hypothetical protein